MRRLYSFLMVTLDGFYEGPNQEFDFWTDDGEFREFSVGQLNDTDILLFGRMTYAGMASYWPTPGAHEDDPVVAELMNTLPKIVVSTTLESADWNSTRVVGANVAEEVSKLKRQPGKDLAVLGSPNLTVSLHGDGPGRRAAGHGQPGSARRRQVAVPKHQAGAEAEAAPDQDLQLGQRTAHLPSAVLVVLRWVCSGATRKRSLREFVDELRQEPMA